MPQNTPDNADDYRHPLERPLHPLERPPQRGDPNYDEDEQEQRRGVPIPGADRTPYVTYALIVINVAIFLLRYFDAPATDSTLGWADELFLQAAIDTQRIVENNEWYRLLTAMFFHVNEAHILFNALAIYFIGNTVERFYGITRYLIIYFLGGLAGSVLHVLLGGYDSLAAGASGAAFALWGAEVVYLYNHRDVLGQRARLILQNSLVFMGMNFLIGFAASGLETVSGGEVQAVIANWAHVGGVVGGALLAWWIGPRLVLQRRPDAGPLTGTDADLAALEVVDSNPLRQNWALVGAFAAGLVVLFALTLLILRP